MAAGGSAWRPVERVGVCGGVWVRVWVWVDNEAPPPPLPTARVPPICYPTATLHPTACLAVHDEKLQHAACCDTRLEHEKGWGERSSYARYTPPNRPTLP